MTILTLNEKALDRWARSLHISSITEKNMLDIKEVSISQDVSHHKKRKAFHSLIIEEEEDPEKYKTFYKSVYTLLMPKINQQKL